MLHIIRRSLPRRPVISSSVFHTLKDLSILKPLRGKTHKHVQSSSIPVRITTNRILSKYSTNSTVNHENIAKLMKISNSPNISCSVINCRSVNNKAAFLSDFIQENNFDCVGLTETWLNVNPEENQVVLKSLVPPGYKVHHHPRASTGGGVGFICKDQYVSKVDSSHTFSSFESISVLLTAKSFLFRFIILYRIPPSSRNKLLKSAFQFMLHSKSKDSDI